MRAISNRSPKGLRTRLVPPLLAGFALCWLWQPPASTQASPPAPAVIYETGFEVSEGYSAADELRPLEGQMGWEGEGSGGNGVVTNFFTGWGQQAFIGFAPPVAPKYEFLNVWRPVGFTPPALTQPVVNFSVLMMIADSSRANAQYDDFRWSVYNTAGSRLFSVDFDNFRGEVFYALDDNQGFKSTGFQFHNDVIYDLVVSMNFARNTWTATMNGLVVVESQPLTTINARLDFGDADAVWAIRTPGAPGDNYMVFDDYRVTLEATPSIPPLLELVGRRPDGQFELLVHGERGLDYAVDVTTDFAQWSALATNRLANGLWRFLDSTAPAYPLSFYRARQLGH